MNQNYWDPEGYAADYRKYNVHSSFNVIVGNPRFLARKLRKTLDNLPKNLNDPDLDWGRLKSLFYQKETAHAEAKDARDTLPAYLQRIDIEIMRCRENLAALNNDLKHLQTEGTRASYLGIITAHTKQYRNAVNQRTTIRELMVEMDAILRESAARQMPKARPRPH